MQMILIKDNTCGGLMQTLKYMEKCIVCNDMGQYLLTQTGLKTASMTMANNRITGNSLYQR